MSTPSFKEQLIEAKEVNESQRKLLTQEIEHKSAELLRLATEWDGLEDTIQALKVDEGYIKLYNVPRRSWVSLSKDPKTLFFFDHIDGAYSYCLSIEGTVMHIGANSWVLQHSLALDPPTQNEYL